MTRIYLAKSFLSEKTSYLLLYFSALAALIIQFGFILNQTDAIGGAHWYVKLFMIGAESALTLTPFWLLPRRWRWLVFVPLLLTGIWLLIAIWYFRFWHDIPAVSGVMLTANFNSELFRSVLGLWQLSDSLALLPTISLLILYCCILRRGAEEYIPTTAIRLAAVAVSIIIYAGSHAVCTISRMRYLKSNGLEISYSDFPQHFKRHLTPDTWRNANDVRSRGVVIAIGQQVIDAFKMRNLRRELTPEENHAVKEFIAATSLPDVIPDSLRIANSRKNIILIIVESLNSSVITDSITPTLSALLREQGTVSALNIESQIAAGCSGDGQLLANTGLLPLTSFYTSVGLGSSTEFPSLPRLTGRKTHTAIFADDASGWNERNTFTSYGFETIYCNTDFPELHDSLGSDLAMISFADSIIPTLPEPFLLELVTESMHIPFTDPNVPDSLAALHLTHPDEVTEKYIRIVNYFDYSLSRLIKTLKDMNIYENTLLFIVSDHPQNITATDSDTQTMAFIAANTGLTESISRPTLQSDVFPTILQLSGSDGSTIWKGAGKSLLGPGQTEQWQAAAREISELILRGDFFRGKICNE